MVGLRKHFSGQRSCVHTTECSSRWHHLLAPKVFWRLMDSAAAAQRKNNFQSELTKLFAKGVAIVVGGIVLAVCLILLVSKFLFKRPTEKNPE